LLKGLLTFALTRRPLVLLGLIVFVTAGFFAFFRLNIEAYPNPAPVILEITAQSPGLSAEEMERYFTVPIEVGLAATPGVDVIRSTSFYGLSFVRVVFQYGIDYYFALTQTAINLQQNVSLPGGITPQIQATSLVGEIYRYEVIGPPHFGLSNLRTVQDWILQRRLLAVPGVVQVNTWGGTTKEYDVDVDLQKLEAYGVTLPHVISAIGNANVNVGGRTINMGQQSVNVRGIGLMDSGGETNLSFFKNDEYDQLFRRARSTRSDAERAKLYARMTEIVAAYAPMGGGVYRIENTIAKPWIVGYKKDSFRSQPWRFVDVDLARMKGAQ